MAQPVNSTSSSSTTPSDSNKKRTREQPNLSECHSCLTRINHTCNPQERLKPLPSLWRIVLLCKKCINNFSNTCTYCFKPINTPLDNINNNNIVTCTLCNNRIHLQCVTSFKDSAPWRYLKEEFTVCVDCWVPDSLKKALRRVDRGNGGVKNRKFVFKGNESRKFKRRIDAIQIMDDKELAARFRNVFSSFPRIERSEFSLDSRDVNVWKIRYWGGISYKRSRVGRECGEGKKVGFSCLENGVRSDEVNIGLVTYKRDKKRKVWKIDDADIMVSESGSYQSGEKFELCSDKVRTTCSTDVSKDVHCVNGDKSGDRYIRVNAGIGVDRFGEKIAIYKRSRFRGKGQVNGTVYESGECRVCDNHECTCKIKHRQPDDEKDMTRIIVECDGNEILPNGSCNTEHDRYNLKYFKRVATTKSCSTHLKFGTEGCKNKCPALSNSETDSSFKCVDELRLPNENGDAVLDRYSLKYVKRVKGSESGIKC